jgi:hypothetical protein
MNWLHPSLGLCLGILSCGGGNRGSMVDASALADAAFDAGPNDANSQVGPCSGSGFDYDVLSGVSYRFRRECLTRMGCDDSTESTTGKVDPDLESLFLDRSTADSVMVAMKYRLDFTTVPPPGDPGTDAALRRLIDESAPSQRCAVAHAAALGARYLTSWTPGGNVFDLDGVTATVARAVAARADVRYVDYGGGPPAGP